MPLNMSKSSLRSRGICRGTSVAALRDAIRNDPGESQISVAPSARGKDSHHADDQKQHSARLRYGKRARSAVDRRFAEVHLPLGVLFRRAALVAPDGVVGGIDDAVLVEIPGKGAASTNMAKIDWKGTSSANELPNPCGRVLRGVD